MPENKMLNRLAKIADELDARGLYQEADKITSLIKQEALRIAAKGEDKKDSLVNKILSLLKKKESNAQIVAAIWSSTLMKTIMVCAIAAMKIVIAQLT